MWTRHEAHHGSFRVLLHCCLGQGERYRPWCVPPSLAVLQERMAGASTLTGKLHVSVLSTSTGPEDGCPMDSRTVYSPNPNIEYP